MINSYAKALLPIGLTFLAGLNLLHVTGCQSLQSELRVLEKSRQTEPNWLKSGVGIRPSEQGIEYVLLKDKVLDLPLGLAQVEASSLYNLKFRMFELIIGNIDTVQMTPEARKKLRIELSKILDKELSRNELKDIYFDKVSVPQAENELIPEYYRIYTLAHVDATKRAEITDKIKSFIKSSTVSPL